MGGGVDGRAQGRAPASAPSSFVQAPRLWGAHADAPAELAYRAWVQHRASCSCCGAEDWYEPSREQLCREGRRKFGAWARVAIQNVRVGPYRKDAEHDDEPDDDD